MQIAIDILYRELNNELLYIAINNIQETTRAKTLREAIEELKAVTNRGCEGCKNISLPAKCDGCARAFNDCFEKVTDE